MHPSCLFDCPILFGAVNPLQMRDLIDYPPIESNWLNWTKAEQRSLMINDLHKTDETIFSCCLLFLVNSSKHQGPSWGSWPTNKAWKWFDGICWFPFNTIYENYLILYRHIIAYRSLKLFIDWAATKLFPHDFHKKSTQLSSRIRWLLQSKPSFRAWNRWPWIPPFKRPLNGAGSYSA